MSLFVASWLGEIGYIQSFSLLFKQTTLTGVLLTFNPPGLHGLNKSAVLTYNDVQ